MCLREGGVCRQKPQCLNPLYRDQDSRMRVSCVEPDNAFVCDVDVQIGSQCNTDTLHKPKARHATVCELDAALVLQHLADAPYTPRSGASGTDAPWSTGEEAAAVRAILEILLPVAASASVLRLQRRRRRRKCHVPPGSSTGGKTTRVQTRRRSSVSHSVLTPPSQRAAAPRGKSQKNLPDWARLKSCGVCTHIVCRLCGAYSWRTARSVVHRRHCQRPGAGAEPRTV